MDCFCGCGIQVPRGLTEANLRLGETALELLAWDRYRTLERLEYPELVEVDRLIDQGAGCHRRLLAAVHGDRDDRSMDESDEWLGQSRSAWAKRPSMMQKGSLLQAPRLRLTEADLDRLDRVHPERSFSAETPARADPGGEDLVEKLERLGVLFREGLLSEDEFQAAKAKLLD